MKTVGVTDPQKFNFLFFLGSVVQDLLTEPHIKEQQRTSGDDRTIGKEMKNTLSGKTM